MELAVVADAFFVKNNALDGRVKDASGADLVGQCIPRVFLGVSGRTRIGIYMGYQGRNARRIAAMPQMMYNEWILLTRTGSVMGFLLRR